MRGHDIGIADPSRWREVSIARWRMPARPLGFTTREIVRPLGSPPIELVGRAPRSA